MSRWVIPIGTVLAVVGVAALAGDLKPPLVGMADHTDGKKIISMQLPVNWQEEKMPVNFGAIVHWSGFFQPPNPTGPDANIEVSAKPTWSRAELAYWDESATGPGKQVDGSVRRGDGWVEEVRKEDARQRFFLFRYVESHGQVFELSAYSHESIYPHVDDHLRALFDTFKAQSPWPAFTPPDGYASSTVDGTVVWTDTKDKKTLKHVLDAHAATWTAMSKWVSGDRAIADPPIVVVCDKDAVFTELAKLSNAEASPTCFPDFQRRIFVARVGGKTNALLDRMTHDFAALQYLQYFFGGHTPDWVSFGLGKWSMAAFEAKSKPEKATSEFIKLAKDGLAAHPERLDGMLEIRRLTLAPADYDHFDFACYAWHCFFRFGAGAKPYGDRYSKYLADLRKTGSPDEAKKAWDGVDFDAMSAEFRAWVAAWK